MFSVADKDAWLLKILVMEKTYFAQATETMLHLLVWHKNLIDLMDI